MNTRIIQVRPSRDALGKSNLAGKFSRQKVPCPIAMNGRAIQRLATHGVAGLWALRDRLLDDAWNVVEIIGNEDVKPRVAKETTDIYGIAVKVLA